jgi:S-methylmethionine-dependent homocysteine/selenocysteine methylase
MQQLRRWLVEEPLLLTEAAVIEHLSRQESIVLDPLLANATLMYDPAGRGAMEALYEGFIEVARIAQVPFLMATPTWRASKARLTRAGERRPVNSDAVRFLAGIRDRQGPFASRILVGGLVGSAGDAYRPEEAPAAEKAAAIHDAQIRELAEAGADYLLAATIPAVSEAEGIARSMGECGLPYLISFVIRRDGSLLDGTSLEEAMRKVDRVAGSTAPTGFMVNCAYPTFLPPGTDGGCWKRLVGFQANGSSMDQGDLDGSEATRMDPVEDWVDQMARLHRHRGVRILGGCCGTTKRHLRGLIEHLGY